MRRYPFFLLTIFLIFFLGGPFILKLKDPRLEIYPAVIFPSGANTIKTNQNLFNIYSLELYGYKDSLKKIDKRKFLNGIPVQYLYAIQEGNFGLEKYCEKFKLYKPPIQFHISNNYNPKTVAATKNWLKKRLSEQDLNDSAFVVRQYNIRFNLHTRTIKSKEIINEKVFILD